MNYQNAYSTVLKLLKPRKIDVEKATNEGYDPNVSPEACTSFEELMHSYEHPPDNSCPLYMTDGLRDSMAVILAVSLSLKLGGDPLWVYLIGPPSSGKSTLAACLEAAHPYCYSLTKITGIFSGWTSGVRGDASLLSRFQDRVVVFKDFTAILSLPPNTKENIFGELRDLYDGTAAVHYRNREQHSYNNVRFAILACVTDEIRLYNRTGLGERFLQVEIDSHWDETGRMARHSAGTAEHIQRAISNMLMKVVSVNTVSTGNLLSQKCRTWGLLEHLHRFMSENPDHVQRLAKSVDEDKEFCMYAYYLALWVAYARAQVKRDRDKELEYRPRPEYALRVAGQLTKLAVSVCMVFQIDHVDARVRGVIRKLALDTAISFRLETMLHLSHHNGGKGLTRDELCKHLNRSPTGTKGLIDDMRELGIIEQVGQQGGQGRPAHVYRLTQELRDLAVLLGFQ